MSRLASLPAVPPAPAEPPVPARAQASLGSWILQRMTGALLAVFLVAHLWVVHYAVAGEISFQEVSARLSGPGFRLLDLGLLALALVHALVGLRRVILDAWWFSVRGARVVTGLLFLAGLWGAWVGWRVFAAFALRGG